MKSVSEESNKKHKHLHKKRNSKEKAGKIDSSKKKIHKSKKNANVKSKKKRTTSNDIGSSSSISLAMFEKRLKQKNRKSSAESSLENKADEAGTQYESLKADSRFTRCSIEELLQFWNSYTESSLTAVESDQFEFHKKFVGCANELAENNVQFLKTNLSGWKEFLANNSLEKGAPYILLFCSSAVRAVNLSRELLGFKTEKCRTAKLFSKHFKLEAQKQFLSKHVVHFGIGTPQRVKSLLDENSLKTNELRFIIFDWAHLDEKKRRMFDLPYIRNEIFDLLKKHFFAFLKSETVKIVLL